MPNDERILETMPTGTLGLIPTASCMELGKKVDSYLSTWREHREHEHHNDIAFKEYHKESYIIEPHIPRFGSGEAKCVINQSVRGYDLYIMVDVTNYSMTYSLCGHTNHMSPDDHYADIKRVIAAASGKARKNTDIMPFLYESRQHRRSSRESMDCAVMLQELVNMGVDNIITFDAHDPRVNNAIPISGFESVMPTYQFIKNLLRNVPDIKLDSDHLMMISPDEGAMGRVVYYANVLGVNMGMFYKRRDYTKVVDGRNPIVAHEYLGDSVEGKDVLIIDDMISSGGSLIDTFEHLKEKGARRIFSFITFGLFCNGLDKFDKAYKEGLFDKIFITNLNYRPQAVLDRPWIVDVDLSKYTAYVIDAMNHDASIGDLIDPNKKIVSLLHKLKGDEPVDLG